jgi:twinkle protein
MNPTVTVFARYSETKTPYCVPVQKILDRIKTGRVAAKVRAVQTEADRDKKRKLKAELPCILFSGVFLQRADNALSQHSGLICLDFDHLPNAYAFRDSMKEKPFVYAAFLSPTHTGVKVLVRVPPVASQHRGHFAALRKRFPSCDASGVNESRICYESHDPDIYINPEAEEFTDYEAPQEAPPPPRPLSPSGAVRADYAKLNICAAMIRAAVDGEKHHVLLKAARLAGGYIASGYFDEAAAVLALEAEILGKPGVDDSEAARKTIRDGIAYGKQKPLYEHETTPAPKTTAQHGFVFVSDVFPRMLDGFRHGKAKGESTYFNSLNPHFTWKAGDFTLFSGRPNSGKSEFVYQLMLAKAAFDGWKWAVFTPENFPADEFYDTLIHALVGKAVEQRFSNVMTEAEYTAAAQFIQDHFFFLYPDTKHTVEEIERNFEYAIREFGCKGVLVDPFNQLSRQFTERDDQFLDGFLSDRKRFALTHNICYTMTAHPRGMRKNKDGEYEEVDFYDLSGGAMWGNKIDNFLVVHRPFQSSDPKNAVVEIIVRKIKKQKLVGVPGRVTWSFDRATNRFKEPVYGSPFEKWNPAEHQPPPKEEEPAAPETSIFDWSRTFPETDVPF